MIIFVRFSANHFFRYFLLNVIIKHAFFSIRFPNDLHFTPPLMFFYPLASPHPWRIPPPFAPKQYYLRMRTIQNWACNYLAFLLREMGFFLFCWLLFLYKKHVLWETPQISKYILANRFKQMSRRCSSSETVFLFYIFFPYLLPCIFSQQLFLRLSRLRKWNFLCLCIKLPSALESIISDFFAFPFIIFFGKTVGRYLDIFRRMSRKKKRRFITFLLFSPVLLLMVFGHSFIMLNIV